MALNEHKAHTVYTRSSWLDAWVAVPYLYANTFRFACGPDTSDAELEYHYGHILQPGANIFATFTPLDIVDKYVKIAVTDGPTWYGIIVEDADERMGGQTINNAEVLTGRQIFLCRGLEYLLQRKTIDSSVVKDANGPGGETEIGRAIGFNLGEGLPRSVDKIGNMSTQLGNDGSAVFAASLVENNVEWDAYQILRYLLKIHRPETSGGLDKLGWTINDNIARQTLSGLTPVLQCEGKTFFQVLNELIDRRRLMGWYVYVDPNNEFPEIRLFTFNRNPIALPDNQNIIVDNQNPVSWDFDQENQVQVCTLASDDAAKFHRVLAKGDPPGGCFTVSIQNGLLETDWSAAQETLYENGDPNAQPDDWTGHGAHQSARFRDEVRKVYRYFRIPPGFTGFVGASAVWPYDQNNTNLCLPFWWPGLRLQDKLPLRIEHDYTTVAAVTNALKTSSKWEYRRPFVFVAPLGEKAEYLDRMSRSTLDSEIESGGRFWSCSLRSMDDSFGIIVDVHGAPQHAIASGSFTPADDNDAVDYGAEVDYNYMYATVFAECDGHVTRPWPQGIVNPGTDTLKELIIYVPDARLDYLVPGTVIDIDENGAVVQSTGGFVRDDTDYLDNVARSAYEWYNQTRKSIGVTIHTLTYVFGVRPAGGNESIWLGSLLTSIGGNDNAETINSVVTSIAFDTRAGTSSYLTQFGELDLQ